MPRGVPRIPDAREWVLTKKCADCDEVKPWAKFPPRSYWPDGSVRSICAVCNLCGGKRAIARRREWGPERRERWRVYFAAWQRKRDAEVRADRARGPSSARLPVEPLRWWLNEFLAANWETPQEFAERVGVSDRAIRRVLREHSHVTVDLADRILIANGVLLNELYPLGEERMAA